MKVKMREGGRGKYEMTWFFAVAKRQTIVSLQKPRQGPYGPVLDFTGRLGAF